MYRRNISACQLLPRVLDPLHLDLLLRVSKIVGQHTKCTIAEKEINLLQCKLISLLHVVSI
jgi:hypothetical protein